jgi:hypothetical protein
MSEALAREQLLVGVKDHLDAAVSLFDEDGLVDEIELLEQQLFVAHRYAVRARNARSVDAGDLPEDVLHTISSGFEHDEPLDDEAAADADAVGDQRTDEVTQNDDAVSGESEAVKDKAAETKADEDLRKEDAKSRAKHENKE